MAALRISSTVSEAVTAFFVALGALVALVALLESRAERQRNNTSDRTKSRRRIQLWTGSACLVAAAAGLIITLTGSHHAVPPKHLPQTTSTSTIAAVVRPTPSEIAQQAALARRHHLQEAGQHQLASFIQAVMQQPVSCTPNEQLPQTVTAQQVCRFGSIQVVFTRLDSVAATKAFFKARYLNSFPFTGYAGQHCGYSSRYFGGLWSNEQGSQGYWVFRTSDSDVILLWEYRSHRIVVRASKQGTVNGLCELWYAHSGETP
jgi:hypothetical protein